METIDWEALAREVGSLGPSRESGGTELAKAALGLILGDREIRCAVSHYLDHRPGSELVRSVLWLLRPKVAARECHRVFRQSEVLEERQDAVELLRVVGDGDALPWLGEFLDDPDPSIQNWGIGLLDQLVWSDLIEPEDAEPWILRAERHHNEHVRERAAWIREVQSSRDN